MAPRAALLCLLVLAAGVVSGCSVSDITGSSDKRDKLGAVGTARVLNSVRPVLRVDRSRSPQSSSRQLRGTSKSLRRVARKVGSGRCQRTLRRFTLRLSGAARIAMRYGPGSRQYATFVARNVRPFVVGVSRHCR